MAALLKLAILLYTVITLTRDFESSEISECSQNEEWLDDEHAIACEGYCFDGGQPVCFKMEPSAGCFCKRGYIRNIAKKCIKRENCTPVDVRSKAPTDEKVDGGFKNAANELTVLTFPADFESADGYHFEYTTTETPIVPRECGQNEVWLDKLHAIACEGYCFDGGQPVCFKMEPTAACYCKRGYIRNIAKKCIKRENCTPADDHCKDPKFCKNLAKELTVVTLAAVFPTAGTSKECGVNEQWFEYCEGSDCGNICFYFNQICPRSCESAGCYCRSGYMRNKAYQCVKPEECTTEVKQRPSTIAIDEKVGGAGKNTAKELTVLTLPAAFESFKGPTAGTPKECGVNEQWFEYCEGSDCGNICSYFNQICPRSCESAGCYCKSGYMRNKAYRCVKPEECPTEAKPIYNPYRRKIRKSR